MAADLWFGEGTWEVTSSTDASVAEHITRVEDAYWKSMVSSSKRMSYLMLETMVGNNSYALMNVVSFEDTGICTSRKVGTVDEARVLADAFVAQLWPEMLYDSTEDESSSMSNRISSQHGWRFHYTRRIGEIAVTHVYQHGAQGARDMQYLPPLPYEKLWVDVGADGIFQVRYEHPVDITGMLMPDVELLSFEQIMEVFGAVAPLTIAAYEGDANNTLCIDRITLGYICVQMRDNPARCEMIPAWDFFGTRTIKNEKLDEHNWSHVTINAIDGTVIDRSYGY